MYKVLVADDEPFILEGIRHIINWEEYGIELSGTASNGIEALELLKEEEPHLLITDIKMPKMTGLELIQRVKELKYNTRFIILSGYDDFEYLKESIKLGIENYLLKPINPDELEATIVNALNKIEDSNLKKSYFNEDINIIKNNILYRWVTNSINQNELRERASLLNISLESSPYTVCILRIFPYTANNKDTGTLSQEVEMICSELITSNSLGLVFCTPDDNIVFVLSGLEETSEYMGFKKMVTECLSNLKEKLKVDFFFTIGSSEKTYNLVEKSYSNAMELQQYSIVLPRNSILDYSTFKQSMQKSQIHEVISHYEISKYVSAKDLDSLVSYIDNSFKTLMRLNGLTPTFVKNTAAELLFCIVSNARLMVETKNSLISDLEYCFSDIYKMQSSDEISELIKATAKKVVNLIIEKDENINPLIKRTLDYIKTNYSCDLCLKSLASDLNTNSNYLGQLFREETGEYFSDYVNKVRVNKAKELLKSTSSSTRDISIQVGYKDANYFYKAFKKYSGVSPSEFRCML